MISALMQTEACVCVRGNVTLNCNNRPHFLGSRLVQHVPDVRLITGLGLPQVMHGTKNKGMSAFRHKLSSEVTMTMTVSGSTKQQYGSTCKHKLWTLCDTHLVTFAHPGTFHVSSLFHPPQFLQPRKCHFPGVRMHHKWRAMRQCTSSETGEMIVFCGLSQLWRSSNHLVVCVFKFFVFCFSFLVMKPNFGFVTAGPYWSNLAATMGGAKMRNPQRVQESSS